MSQHFLNQLLNMAWQVSLPLLSDSVHCVFNHILDFVVRHFLIISTSTPSLVSIYDYRHLNTVNINNSSANTTHRVSTLSLPLSTLSLSTLPHFAALPVSIPIIIFHTVFSLFFSFTSYASPNNNHLLRKLFPQNIIVCFRGVVLVKCYIFAYIMKAIQM